MPVTIDAARAAKAALRERLRDVDAVVGIGITRVKGDYAVKINLSCPVPDDVVPPEVHGVCVVVEVVGTIRPR